MTDNTKTYRDATYFKYKDRDRRSKEQEREKDLLDANVSFEEYMMKHELKDNPEYEHEKFLNKKYSDKMEDIYLNAMEKITDAHSNILDSTLKLLRAKKERGEL
jgi:hypothetical protein